MVTVERDGSLTFRVYLPHAQSVDLVGDFTGWAAGRVPLEPEHGGEDKGSMGGNEEGWWHVNFRCPAGDHAFSYLVDNHWWFPDYAAHGVQRNQFGNWTSLLFVHAPAPRPQRPHTPRLDRDFARHRAEAAQPTHPAPEVRWDPIRERSHFAAASPHPSAG